MMVDTNKYQNYTTPGLGLFVFLRQDLVGKILVRGDKLYEAKQQSYWNGLLRKYEPLAFVEVHCEKDVIFTVKFCITHKMQLCVCSGGHSDFGGGDNVIVIDLSQLQQINVNAHKEVIFAEPGATIGDVDTMTTKHNLAVTLGTASSVCIGGQALDLGIGFLARRFGYLIDNILSYDVVLATGEKIFVSKDSHPDLFWAMKGYGANFGIVTNYSIKLHPIPSSVTGGSIYYAWNSAQAVIQHARDFQTSFNIIRELTLFVILHVAKGGLQVFCRLLFSGAASEGTEIFQRFISSCPATCLYNSVELLPYDTFQRSYDSLYSPGHLYYLHPGHFLSELPDAYIKATVDAFSCLTCEEHIHSTAYFEPLGGAVTDKQEDSSPFLFRKARFWAGIVGAARSAPGYRDVSNIIDSWNSQVSHHAIKADQHKEEKVFSQLKNVKKKYDPSNVFRFNACNIDPSD